MNDSNSIHGRKWERSFLFKHDQTGPGPCLGHPNVKSLTSPSDEVVRYPVILKGEEFEVFDLELSVKLN